jgi:pilus assembly protein CpaC
MGINYSFTNKQGINFFHFGTGTTGNLPFILDNGRVLFAINALRTVNLARSLAEPNLVTLNGQPANFFAGGEFPIPVVTGATATGLQGISYVPFGVQLQFTPIITCRDRIRLQLTASVSTLQGNSLVNGNVTPNLQARTVQTVVEMREGQTFAVGGLLQNSLTGDTNRVPGLGDLPILGNLFRSSDTSADESELILLVTPELVRPLEPNQRPALPGSDYFEPGDLEFYLLGRLESGRPYDYRSPVMDDINRMAAYRRCELLYFVGPHGHSDGR